MAKAIVAYHQKYVDEQTKRQIKEQLLQYDRTLLVADPRRCEPKKWVAGGDRVQKGRGRGAAGGWGAATAEAAMGMDS